MQKGKQLFHVLDDNMKEQLLAYRKTGLQKGAWVGWQDLYDHWSIKRGSTTYILAAPASGKSTFTTEIIMNLAEFENQRIIIFTPETGSPREIFAELLWAKLKEPFVNFGGNKKSGREVEKAIDFISEHFVIIDNAQQDLNEQLYFRAIFDYQEATGNGLDVAVLDSVSDVELSGNHRDLALGRFLTRMRNLSSANDIHTIMTFHTRTLPLTDGKKEDGSKTSYKAPPTLNNFAGGEMPSRKGFFILGLWRPPANVIDPETGFIFPRNETRIEILKAKPKAIGKLGVVKLYYDAFENRYYEEGIDGQRIPSYPKDLTLQI